ncbi:MAG TPA: hypothetical protein VMU34_23210, partial [Mycobacterium sp.]|nr:hypothetical protein [Mycobacterium sp.]
MRDLVRSSITGIAIAAASVLAITPAAPPTGLLPSVAVAEVRLAAAANPPPGALIERFLLNQLQNCSLICPFIVQGVVEVPLTFAVIPLTFARELRSGQSLLKAIALTDETVSGAANAALTGIIDRDLGLVLPRAQNALEVAVVGLIDVATTAVTQPA